MRFKILGDEQSMVLEEFIFLENNGVYNRRYIEQVQVLHISNRIIHNHNRIIFIAIRICPGTRRERLSKYV